MKTLFSIHKAAALLLFTAWAFLSGAAQNVPPFRFERSVQPGGKGPNRLAVDVPLLAGAASPSLRDLRFYDGASHEVPYLLVPPPNPEPRWKEGRILAVAATKETSGFEADLGAATPSDRLRLSGIPTPFLKRFRLEGSGDRSHWTLLAGEGTLFDLPDEGLRLTEIGFLAGEYRYFRVTWDDRKSGRVPNPRRASARLAERLSPPPPIRVPVEFQRLASEPGRSRFRIRLPGSRLPLAALELTVGTGHLLRPARVHEPRLSGGEVVPVSLGSATLRRAEREGLAAADLRIPINPPEGREIELVVEDGNNPSLGLSGVLMELAPVPWIYVESATGEPLTARFGNDSLSAPRYDLEAMREHIPEAHLSEASWGESRDLRPQEVVAESSALPAVGAPVDAKQFHYSRPIPAGKPGLASLILDVAVLAHSSADLEDLRIADEEGRQIPYLLEKRDEPLSLDLPAPARETAKETKGESRYRLTLPYEKLPPSRLVLTTTARVFERKVSVEVTRPPADARSEPRVETVAEAEWRHADPETTAPSLVLSLATLSVSQAMLVVDEGDNSPLPLSSARLLLPAYRLRFFHPAGAELRLFYGQPGMTAPRYDLALLAPRLVGMSGRELSLAPETAAPAAPDKTAGQKKLFWGVLIGAVVVLLLLLTRLLRSAEQKPASSG